jgi:RNA polymerase sigma-70 factor (ECF subfamily)
VGALPTRVDAEPAEESRLDLDDRRRFEQATLPHLDAAYNLARWLTRDEHAAEDVVQEAFLRAARFFASFRGGDGRPWLLAVVRRASYDWLHKRGTLATTSFDEDVHGQADEALNPESVLIRKADLQLLERAVSELLPEFREVIVLRELEGLSYQAIAAVAGIPVGTVMSRLSRARKQLQLRLAPCPGAED